MNHHYSESLNQLFTSLETADLGDVDVRSTFGLNDQNGLDFLQQVAPRSNVRVDSQIDSQVKIEPSESDSASVDHPVHNEGSKNVPLAEKDHLNIQLNKLTRSLDGDERFDVNTSIGEGSFGKVWYAIDHNLKRSVAIKTFKGEKDEAQNACQEEVKFVGRLDHPSIPTVYDMGLTEEGHPFLMMKLLDGEPLNEIITRLRFGDETVHKRYSFIKRADIIIQLLRVLMSAHKVGVLHRDIKPENILIGADGHLSLIDWGCAVEMSEVKERSVICGTPLFMSPEQVCGAGLSEASDLFAVGGVAYELFCLQPPAPTEGSLHEVLQAILTYRPQSVDLMSHPIQGYVPSEFQPTIMTALHRDPMHRPQSAEEMMNTLQRALDGHIEVVCPRSRIKYLLARFSRWLDYNPYKAVSRVYLVLYSSIILFILIGMGLGALLFSYFG